MTFSSRPRSHARWTSLIPWTVVTPFALVLTLAAGCADKHIGRPCELGPAAADGGAPSTGTAATIYPEALECPSRICLLPGADQATDTGALCTDGCSNNDDCDGEGRSTGNPLGCKMGFVCMVPTTVGDFCCRKLCVCKDFVGAGPFTTPAVCMSGSGSTCKNVH